MLSANPPEKWRALQAQAESNYFSPRRPHLPARRIGRSLPSPQIGCVPGLEFDARRRRETRNEGKRIYHQLIRKQRPGYILGKDGASSRLTNPRLLDWIPESSP